MTLVENPECLPEALAAAGSSPAPISRDTRLADELRRYLVSQIGDRVAPVVAA